MKRFYLVRHGESEANIAQVHGGHHHPLSPTGRSQAERIAERFERLPIQALLSSDMVRAKQTAEAIAARVGVGLTVVPELQELRMPSHMMERSNVTPEAVAEELELIENMRPGHRHSDEENFDDMVARAARVLELLASQPHEHVGVVTHGLFLRCIVGRAIFGPELSPRELLCLWRGLKTVNTGLTILEYRSDRPKGPWGLRVWNDHAHLG